MSGSAGAEVPDVGARQDKLAIKKVALPSSVQELSAFLAAAAKDGTAVVPGLPGRVPPAAERRPIIYCHLEKLNQVLEHAVADQVVEVQTGIKISDLNKLLAKSGQFLPVAVPADWTLLDAIQFGQSGTLEHGYGAVRELVLGLGAVLADGTVICTGGRVVKNVTGYDVTKLIVGGHGSLAMPFSAHLRLYALPEASLTMVWSFDSLWKLMNSALKLLHSGLPFAALEAVQNVGKGPSVGRFVLLAQIFSLQAVIDEIATAAVQVVGRAQTHLQGPQEEELWNDLRDFFLPLQADAEKVLQVVAPPALLPDVAEALPPGSRWQMRPGRAGLRAVCPQVAQAVANLAAIAGRSRQHDACLTVAYADDTYNHVVRQLPAHDQVRTALKARIKQELDPTFTFNPFVAL